MITDQLNKVIEKYEISKTQNIIYGTNIPRLNAVIPTPWRTYLSFEKSEFYFFYFDELGIKIYLINAEGYVEIPWDDILEFEISHLSIVGKMVIKTKDDTYKFQINRFVVGCPWIKTNTKYLESVNYFYNK